ncbi:MAG: hypothetical protein ACLQUW_09345 [Desulfobaccales bacterium]
MQKSIYILDKLIKQKRAKRIKRSIELLADFSNGYAEGWYFCVPIFFYDALDIKFTFQNKMKLWTQGSTFNFSTGDMIWNHAYPYCENFVSDVKKNRIGVQVQSSAPCLPQTKNRLRNSGKVNFTIFTKRNEDYSIFIWKRAGNYSLSQDEFIEFLIKGYSQSLDLNLNSRVFN